MILSEHMAKSGINNGASRVKSMEIFSCIFMAVRNVQFAFTFQNLSKKRFYTQEIGTCVHGLVNVHSQTRDKTLTNSALASRQIGS